MVVESIRFFPLGKPLNQDNNFFFFSRLFLSFILNILWATFKTRELIQCLK
jgi:hypothetical protein